MFYGTVTNWTSVVGQNIPFVTELSTNSKVTNNSGTISFNSSGYYNIDSSLTLSGTGEVIVSIYKNGVEDETSYAETELTTDVATANVAIIDAIKVILAQSPSIANIGLRVDTAGITVNGALRIEYVR